MRVSDKLMHLVAYFPLGFLLPLCRVRGVSSGRACLLVIAVYVITNLAFFHVMSPGDVARYEAVGSEAIGRLLGDWGRAALAVLVAVSTFGTINGAILTGPRVTQAMAADGLLWRPMATLDPKRATPSTALWVPPWTTLLAVQRHRENARGGRFPNAARPGKQVAVRDPPLTDGAAQRHGDVVLDDEIGELLGAVFAGESNHSLKSTLLTVYRLPPCVC